MVYNNKQRQTVNNFYSFHQVNLKQKDDKKASKVLMNDAYSANKMPQIFENSSHSKAQSNYMNKRNKPKKQRLKPIEVNTWGFAG